MKSFGGRSDGEILKDVAGAVPNLIESEKRHHGGPKPLDNVEVYTTDLLKTLKMQSCYFTQQRCNEGTTITSDLLCPRAVPRFDPNGLHSKRIIKKADSFQRQSRAKRKLDTILNLVLNELKSAPCEPAASLPKDLVSNVVRRVTGSKVHFKNEEPELFFIAKVDAESLDLDALSEMGIKVEVLFNSNRKVLELPSRTGIIRPNLILSNDNNSSGVRVSNTTVSRPPTATSILRHGVMDLGRRDKPISVPQMPRCLHDLNSITSAESIVNSSIQSSRPSIIASSMLRSGSRTPTSISTSPVIVNMTSARDPRSVTKVLVRDNSNFSPQKPQTVFKSRPKTDVMIQQKTRHWIDLALFDKEIVGLEWLEEPDTFIVDAIPSLIESWAEFTGYNHSNTVNYGQSILGVFKHYLRNLNDITVEDEDTTQNRFILRRTEGLKKASKRKLDTSNFDDT